MDSHDVISALCRVSRKKPGDIQGHVSLATLGVNSSFGLSALRSLLESGGRTKLPPLNAGMKVNDLLGLFSGGTAGSDQAVTQTPAVKTSSVIQSDVPVPNATKASPANMGMGMDMQEIDELPEATDFLTHEFYSSHFAPSEIATAVLRPNPREHLCGIFCAKEAAKKSHPALLNLRMSDLFVSHDKEGRPLLRLAEGTLPEIRFQFILSITHTHRFAAATCLTFWGID